MVSLTLVFSFFAHLADVLGPQDFLAPLLMLLTQKPASRIVRQNAEEVKNSLSLHISILQHYPISLQIFVGPFFVPAI
jgi:U3 small nucleolar RNA-associated protein 10